MTIPKNLQEKRDDEKTAYELCTGPVGYSIGFNSAFNLLLPEIEKLREALNHYNQWSSLKEPDEADIRSDVDCGCCSQGSAGAVAYRALQSWREFLG